MHRTVASHKPHNLLTFNQVSWLMCSCCLSACLPRYTSLIQLYISNALRAMNIALPPHMHRHACSSFPDGLTKLTLLMCMSNIYTSLHTCSAYTNIRAWITQLPYPYTSTLTLLFIHQSFIPTHNSHFYASIRLPA